MSLLIGPGGIALMGNLRSFLTTIQAVASLGIREGVVKFVSEKKEDEAELKRVFSTAFLIILVVSLVVSIAVFVGSGYLNAYLFPGESYANIFKISAFLLPPAVINIFLLAFLNGLHHYKKIIIINSIANVLGVGIILFFMWKYAVEGALIAAVAGESVIILITLFFSRKHTSGLFDLSWYSKTYVKKFLRYSIMALITAIVIPLTFILIRNTIIATLSIDEAGYWEALNRISGMYMIFVSSGLTLYYFPRLAALKTDAEFKSEVVNYYKTLVPLFLAGITVIYFLRKWIILLVLTEDFIVIGELIIWQLGGDLLKVLSLAFGYQILAKSMIGKYVFIEVLFGLLFYVLTLYFIETSGLTGVVQAYFTASLVNFIALLFFFRKTIFSRF